ncbi:MAG TPA: carbohydrate binding domain-containing protein [Candidatus Saccharimonadales bacterium]|nr:carbohydrate binding domain-containing protein [Candidatus Saccharimonadales bacterium]
MIFSPAEAASGINQQLNFQGRLLNSQGAVVPDGYYNMEFKIYQDGDGQSAGDTTGSPTGSLKWTEDWLNTGSTQGVKVVNGYLSVQLGSRTAFGSSVNWNSDTLWLSMQVGNTSNCTISTGFQTDCGGDGEMTPMKRLSSTPYALDAGMLNGLTSAAFVQLAQGVQTDATSASSIFINKTGSSGNIVELQKGGSDAFVIGNTGDVSFGNSANHSISIATAAASSGGKGLTVAGGAAGTGTGALAGGALTLNGGAGGGSGGAGGNVNIDGGLANGAGFNGTINIATNNVGTVNIGKAASASNITVQGGNGSTAVSIQTLAAGTIGVGSNNIANTIQIGSTSLSSGTQTVNVGNNNTSGGTTNVTIGAGGSAAGGTTAIQSKGNTTIATNGTLRATFDNLNNLYLGNGTSNSAPSNFAITGTASSTSGTAGGTLTVKGGDSSTGNTNGGNLILTAGAGAGTGTSGSVIVKPNGSDSTTAFQVQKSDGVTAMLTVDTKNGLIGLGAAPTAGGALVQVSTTLSAGTSLTAPSVIATTGVYTGASGGTERIDGSGNLVNIGNITGSAAVAFQGGAGTSGLTGGSGGGVSITAGAGGNGTATNGNGGDVTISSGAAGTGIGTAGTVGSVIVKNPANSTTAFQVQNSTNSKAVLAVDTTNNQIVLGSPGAGGLSGQIKLYFAGSTGSITLIPQDPGSNNYNLTIPSGGGTICTTANGLCSGGGTGSGGLAKNAVDSSSADAGTGYLYTFTNSGNAGSGGVLSLDNGNNTGPVAYLKGTSAKALQVQTSAGYNALVLDTSTTPAHLKVYDGTATGAYADISYNDGTSSAIFTASAGTAQFGGGSVPTLLTAGSGQAVTITGHTSSSWTLDNGDLTLDVTGASANLNIGTGALAKTVNIGNQTGATAVNIKAGSGNINFIPVGTGNTGVVIKPTNASTLAFQVQNSSSSKSVMSVDNSNNQVVVGDGSASGITGKLAFSYTGASGKIILTPSGSPGSSTFTLQLPSENGTLCTTAGSAACLAVYGGGTAGNFIAKDAVDTSSADSGAGALLTLTNSGSAGSGNVLKLNNNNNTGSTLDATTTGNPGAGKAVIYAENKNAAPTGNLIDLESGTVPTSMFSVDAAGNVNNAGTLTSAGDITSSTGIINSDTLSGNALTFGGASAALIQSAASQALNITGHTDSTWSLDAGNLTLQTSAANSTLTLDAGSSANGTINIGNGGASSISVEAANISLGNNAASTVQIGSASLSSGTQNIYIGNNTSSGGTTNIVIGDGGSASGGSITVRSSGTAVLSGSTTSVSATGTASLSGGTTNISSTGTTTVSGATTNVSSTGTTNISSTGNTTIATNSTTRATFDTSNHLYLGNGTSAASPNNFTILGTNSSATGVAGATVYLQGGNATVGSANGGNVSISGGSGTGTGVAGLVLISTPTFSTTTNDPNCYTGGSLVSTSCTIAQASVDDSAGIIVGFFNVGQIATLPSPTINIPGRVVYVTAANGSSDFTLEVNGGGTGNDIAMRQNTTATMVWSGSKWTAAGASSSTTLQAAYDNTLQSAGGAELVVSHTSATNGLTIRDSSINPVNGTLLSVQTSSAATLISVNGNVTEYASDAGAETAGNTTNTFPAGTWSTVGSSSVSRYTTVGNYVDTGQASVSVGTTTAANDGVKNTLDTALTANMNYNVSFAVRLLSGTFTDLNVYYSSDGTTASVVCTTGKAATISIWTKINCTFAAPASGITSSNAILIRQASSGTARSFYIDNLSVTIAADFNYATDGGVDDNANFSTNWTSVASATVSRNTGVGNDASDSAEVDATTTGQGVRNELSINPLPNTLYRITVYVSSTASGFNSFTVRYSPNGGTNFVNCADYNTQSISDTANAFTKVTCYINTSGTAVTDPDVYFTQSDTATRTFYVDTFSMTLSTDSTPNVQIGGGNDGGPVTLLTLDRAASAPIASNNDAFLGSMYYDTTLGKLQCYEADGWGACGSSPDNIVTISPEYTNAVMHGTGIGTMTSDICSDTLHVNDGTSGQPTICGTNETYNFYKWTSPQASAQTYSIYVTYQLPDTFKTFASGQTSIMGRTDSSNATVQYSVYKEDSTTGLSQCGPTVSVSTGSVSSWKVGVASGAADPSTCGFAPSDSIVFKIDVVASQNADAYVGNLNFTFSNK